MASDKNKSKSPKTKFLFTRRELAEIYDVNEVVVDKWRNKGCPVENKKYDIRQVVKWKAEKIGDFTVPTEEEISKMSVQEQRNFYDMQKAKYDSQIKELKADFESGRYLPKDEVVSQITNALLVFKKGLQASHTKIITRIAHFIETGKQEEVMIEIEDIHKTLLNELAKGTEYK